LSSVQGIILSHYHIDHTGGLWDAVKLAATKSVDVYAHPGLFNEGYLARSGCKYIGVPFCRAALESAGANFKFNTEFIEIAPDLYLTGEVPRVTPYEYGDDDIFLKTSNGFVKDRVWDDQSVILKTERGLLVILGCAHAGIINILTHARQKTGENRIHAVIGGTHLWSVSKDQKEKSIEALTDMSIDRLGVSHCTGFEMSMRLAQVFGERFFNCNVGTVIEV
jgi:7,8-dihydropterin-6-yl-methyl-4-(beta-D-ribofuranosyl)aminobenzene 5'-phosphate synthase